MRFTPGAATEQDACLAPGLHHRAPVPRLLLAALLLLTACETVRVQQSSLVPAAILPPAPRQDGVLDLYLEHSTVTFVSRPERVPSSDAGLWVARHNLQAAATVHASEHMALRLVAVGSPSAGAMRAAPTTLRNPGSAVYGAGTGIAASVPLGSERTQLHLVADFVALSIPSFVRAACTGCSPDASQGGRLDRDPLGQGAFAVVGSQQVSASTRVTLAAAVKNHPTNLEEFDNYAVDAEVHEGPVNVVVGLGVETDIEWFSIAPYLQWPVTRDPVRYGPLLGLGVRATYERPPPSKASHQGPAVVRWGAR